MCMCIYICMYVFLYGVLRYLSCLNYTIVKGPQIPSHDSMYLYWEIKTYICMYIYIYSW